MSTGFDTANAALTKLSHGLRGLHRTLIDAARIEYEKEHGPVSNAGELLQLLTKHPEFAWLRQISEFIVDIDALRDGEPVSDATMHMIFAQAKSLLAVSSEDSSSEFSRRYVALLQQYPMVVMAHAEVRQLLVSM
jgi:hypothetical protein